MQTQIPEWLLELIDNQNVTDILLSSAACQIDFGQGLSSQQNQLLTEPELQLLARELIELGGRRLDHANPFADVSLPGGLIALAAADALRGVSSGNPCVVATDIASDSQIVLE
jgi:Flp pilus assembly CpaF family ATPase